MRPSMTGKERGRLLYRYIGMAFDSAARMSQEPLDGNAEAFLADLYSRRMASVFGEPTEERPTGRRTIRDLTTWLDDLRRAKAHRILRSRVGQIEVSSDDAEGLETGNRRSLFNPDRSISEEELGIEAYATYLPIHFFPEGGWEDSIWGIYISEAGVKYVAEIIEKAFVEQLRDPDKSDDASFLRIAFEVLLRHEMEHFKVESFALSAEMQQRRPVYVPYLTEVYAGTYPTSYCLEESLANATVLNSAVIKKLVFKLYPQEPSGWREILAASLFDAQPPAYANYRLDEPWHREVEKSRLEKVEHTNLVRRDAMNYLCNQIATGHQIPTGELLPFYAFPPDNFFLRAESLVPVYILKDLPDDRSFIHFPTPTRTAWERFLRDIGFTPTDKGKGAHVVWERPGLGIITNRFHGKELDCNSYKSAGRTLGLSRWELDQAVRTKEIPEKLRARLHRPDHSLLFA